MTPREMVEPDDQIRVGPNQISGSVGIVSVDDPGRLPDEFGHMGPQLLTGSSLPIGTPVEVIEFGERTVETVGQTASQSRLSDSANPHDVDPQETRTTEARSGLPRLPRRRCS